MGSAMSSTCSNRRANVVVVGAGKSAATLKVGRTVRVVTDRMDCPGLAPHFPRRRGGGAFVLPSSSFFSFSLFFIVRLFGRRRRRRDGRTFLAEWKMERPRSEWYLLHSLGLFGFHSSSIISPSCSCPRRTSNEMKSHTLHDHSLSRVIITTTKEGCGVSSRLIDSVASLCSPHLHIGLLTSREHLSHLSPVE